MGQIIATASRMHGVQDSVNGAPSHSLSSVARRALRKCHSISDLVRCVKRVVDAASAVRHVTEIGLQALEVDLEGVVVSMMSIVAMGCPCYLPSQLVYERIDTSGYERIDATSSAARQTHSAAGCEGICAKTL